MNQIRRMTAAPTAAKSIKPNSIVSDPKPYMYLRMLIRARRLNYDRLGLLLGIHRNTVVSKMNDTTDWTRTEMYELLNFLSVPHDELARVFPANPKEEPDA